MRECTSLDPVHFGPLFVRVMAALAAGMKGYTVVSCKASPSWCHARYRDYRWEVETKRNSSWAGVNGNATTNGTVAGGEL